MCIACLKYKQGQLTLPEYLNNVKEFSEFEHDAEAEDKARDEFEKYIPGMKAISFDPTFKDSVPLEHEEFDEWLDEPDSFYSDDEWITEIEDNNPED